LPQIFRNLPMKQAGVRTGLGVALSAVFGAGAGLLTGAICMLLGVGGPGPEELLWVMVMPVVGLLVGLVGGMASVAASRWAPRALRVVSATLVTVGVSYAAGQALGGFDLHWVGTVFAAVWGLTCALLWPRWTSDSEVGALPLSPPSQR
jgi:hypothetical protein